MPPCIRNQAGRSATGVLLRTMQIDPIPEDVRQFLIENFVDVRDERPEGDYYVFSLKTSNAQPRTLKVHRNFFIYSEVVNDYLKTQDLAGQLERGNVEIAAPLRP
jgi:hypothetical protein